MNTPVYVEIDLGNQKGKNKMAWTEMFRILLPTWFGFLKDCQIRKHFSRSHISEEWHVIVSYYFINSYVSFREK